MPVPVSTDPRRLLLGLYEAAVSAARPSIVVPPHLPQPPKGRTIVVGAGKASAAMAAAVEEAWDGDLTGAVVTRDGYARPTRKIDVIEAAHPIPDQRSVAAAATLLERVASAEVDDLILCLVSGGASALAVAPRLGVSLAEKQAITRHLLAHGAAIDEINCLRKHTSIIKGGQLAATAGRTPVKSLIISDVVGDDIGVIGSGLTAVDPSTCADALKVIDRYHVPVSPHIRTQLTSGAWETPKVLPVTVENVIISSSRAGLAAAERFATAHNLPCLNLGDRFTSPAADVAATHVHVIEQIIDGRHKFRAPCVVVSGGEAVVNVTGQGRGGPNTEFALAFALAAPAKANVWALAADTDGTDGIGGHAGAIVTPDTLQRIASCGISAREFQTRNDTASLFDRLGDLFVPGPTFTNINDFRAIYIQAN